METQSRIKSPLFWVGLVSAVYTALTNPTQNNGLLILLCVSIIPSCFYFNCFITQHTPDSYVSALRLLALIIGCRPPRWFHVRRFAGQYALVRSLFNFQRLMKGHHS